MNTLSFETRKHLTAAGITVGVTLLLFLVLYFVQYTFPVIPPPVEEMGMLVNLGDSENGSGDIQPLSADNTTETATASASAGGSATAPVQAIETQENDPDAASVQSTKVKKEVKPLTQKPDEKTSAAKALDAADKAAKEKAKAEAEKKAKQDAFKNKLKNALQKSNTSKSEGIGTGSGDQGVVDGDPTAANHSGVNSGLGTAGSGYSIKGLKGRTPRKKALPIDDSKDVGKIAVNITVDKNGNVIKAAFSEKGSTSASVNLRKAAIKAAKEWKFNEKNTDSDETGTVIFNFTNQ